MPENLEPDDANQTELPLTYGTTELVLMARDPNSAHAYWEIDPAQIDRAEAVLGRGKAMLRLFDAATGRLLTSNEVSTEQRAHDLGLPRPACDYVADLAIVRDGHAVVLARSNIVRAPRSTPTRPAEAVFVQSADQSRALALGGTLSADSPVRPSLLPQQLIWLARYGILPAGLRAPWPISGSEARLVGIGSERWLVRRGSEGRLQARLVQGLGPVTPLFTVTATDVPSAVETLATAMGDSGTSDAEPTATASTSQPVTVGNPAGWVPNTWYVPTDDYGHFIPAPDQSAPARGTPGQYMFFTGKGWIQVDEPPPDEPWDPFPVDPSDPLSEEPWDPFAEDPSVYFSGDPFDLGGEVGFGDPGFGDPGFGGPDDGGGGFGDPGYGGPGDGEGGYGSDGGSSGGGEGGDGEGEGEGGG